MGCKLTPQRIAILQYLDGNKEHPSAEDIYKAVRRKFPTMSFATVYSTLAVLKEKKIILELTLDPDKKRYDPELEDHNHMICISCKRIIDIFGEHSLTLSKSERRNFSVLNSHVEVRGLCPECRKTT